MSETLLPNTEHTSATIRIVAVSGERIGNVEDKTLPMRSREDTRRSNRNLERERGPAPRSYEKGCAGQQRHAGQEYPHIRNIREGTTIKLDVNSSVYTMDVWCMLR